MTTDIVNHQLKSHKPNNPAPRVYFACTAARQAAIEHGIWVDVTQTVATIQTEIQSMLATSPIPNASEWEIGCYINVGTLLIDKSISLEELHRQALFIQKYGRLGIALLVYYKNAEIAQEAIIEDYYGHYKSELDFSIDHFDACCLDHNLWDVRGYVDYAAFQRDLFVDDFISFRVGKKVHVFAKS